MNINLTDEQGRIAVEMLKVSVPKEIEKTKKSIRQIKNLLSEHPAALDEIIPGLDSHLFNCIELNNYLKGIQDE